jgi:pentapeptide repeat protein
MLVTDALMANRPLLPLAAPWTHTDLSFAGQRLDGVSIDLGLFTHCTFANVSFKGCTISDTRFVNCTFISCYFRKTTIQNSKFDGCKFIDCDFPKVRVQSTSFMFPQFRACFIAYDEMQPNLPPEPELREMLAIELAREAYAHGDTSDARKYRLAALRAHEKHLAQAFRATSSYYKDHYDVLGRLRAGAGWIGSQVNRLIWGNGERGSTLLCNFLILALIVFPLIYAGVGGVKAATGKLTTIDYVLVSIDSATSYSGLSGVHLVSTGARVVAAIELAIGLLTFGLFITILFRRITRWR